MALLLNKTGMLRKPVTQSKDMCYRIILYSSIKPGKRNRQKVPLKEGRSVHPLDQSQELSWPKFGNECNGYQTVKAVLRYFPMYQYISFLKMSDTCSSGIQILTGADNKGPGQVVI